MASVTNRANQLNPNNWRFWKSRGYSDRPYNWESLVNPEDKRCCCGLRSYICKYFLMLVLCLTLFLIYYLYAKELGNSLMMPNGNITKIVYFSNDSVAMSGTGEEYLTNLTDSTTESVTTEMYNSTERVSLELN